MLERQTALPEGFHSIAMRVFVLNTPLARLVQNAGTLLPSLIPRCKGTTFLPDTEGIFEENFLMDCFSYKKGNGRLHFRGTPPACGRIGYLLMQKYKEKREQPNVFAKK